MSHPSRDFRAVAQRLPVAVCELDATGNWLSVNARWTEWTGQPTGQALGAGWQALIAGDDLPVLDAALRDAVTHQVSVELELSLRAQDGGVRLVRCFFTPDVRGNVVVGFVGLLIDVTASRATDAALSQREARLALLEARHQALLENLPDLLFQFDAQGRYLDFQGSTAAGLVTAPEQFLGRTIDEVLPAPVAALARATMATASSTREPQRMEYELEVPQLGRRDYEARITPMRSGGFLALVRDITDLKRAERQLIATREQALSASSSKSQFLANVSHEIRTPLNGIIGVTQLLRTMTLSPEATEYLGVLETSGESLLALVNEVLDLSKIEADRLELERVTFDLPQVVTQAARAFTAQAKRKGLQLTVSVEASAEGPVSGDPGRVRQVVNNIVGNAVKFTDAGQVTVTLVRGEHGLVLSVVDSGPGILPEHLESIFEPFVQVSGRRGQGTGLGLSIARRLARLMGGDVRVTSQVGLGSTFVIQLPLPRSAPTAVHRPPQRRLSARTLKVLLAEDNEINARLTRSMLEWLGHVVVGVSNGHQAVEAAQLGGFDLVFMDVQMPLLDGLEATRRIRSFEKRSGAHVPIVALTANAMKGDDAACLSAGMDAYLAKPVTVDALNDMLAWFGNTP